MLKLLSLARSKRIEPIIKKKRDKTTKRRRLHRKIKGWQKRFSMVFTKGCKMILRRIRPASTPPLNFTEPSAPATEPP
jgi:hypothetical protein